MLILLFLPDESIFGSISPRYHFEDHRHISTLVCQYRSSRNQSHQSRDIKLQINISMYERLFNHYYCLLIYGSRREAFSKPVILWSYSKLRFHFSLHGAWSVVRFARMDSPIALDHWLMKKQRNHCIIFNSLVSFEKLSLNRYCKDNTSQQWNQMVVLESKTMQWHIMSCLLHWDLISFTKSNCL